MAGAVPKMIEYKNYQESLYGPPIPSLYYLCLYVYRKIVTHPLITTPIIKDPISGEYISIKRYKLKNGIELKEGLACSIFPHSLPTDSFSLPSPTETSLSALFHQEDIGRDFDNVIYHISIKLHYGTKTIFIPHPNDEIKKVRGIKGIGPLSNFYENSSKEIDIKLDLNPSLIVIGDYMELVRFAILDRTHVVDLPIPFNRIEVRYFNFKDAPWEKGRNIYFSEGEILLRLDTRISRIWDINNSLVDRVKCYALELQHISNS
ncbi:hypothetical protein V6O07_00730 [Arthrospira platensis SPKY2]